MNDLDLLVAGAMVTMISFAGAYINLRRRASQEPVQSYAPDDVDTSGDTDGRRPAEQQPRA